jgi:hypothetical protein
MTQLSYQERPLKIQKVNSLVASSSLVALLLCLPSMLLYKLLSCAEISELLTFGNIPLDINSIRASCTQATKLGVEVNLQMILSIFVVGAWCMLD